MYGNTMSLAANIKSDVLILIGQSDFFKTLFEWCYSAFIQCQMENRTGIKLAIHGRISHFVSIILFFKENNKSFRKCLK